MQNLNLSTKANSSDYEWIVSSMMIEPVQVNWALLIQDMRERQISINQQAEILDTTYSKLQRYWKGSEPGFSTGHALLILHSKICGLPLTQERLRRFVTTS